jgi:hypothetical protein
LEADFFYALPMMDFVENHDSNKRASVNLSCLHHQLGMGIDDQEQDEIPSGKLTVRY